MKLETLNDMQQMAVKTTEGPLLVLAGAGSGKTKVLTTRIAYLIEELKVDPTNILAITFTNKAAKEMKERVINMLGIKGHQIQISTFHSFGLSILRENYEKLGYKSNFTILDSEDSLSVIKKIMKDIGYDIKEYNPKAIRSKISGAKNELVDSREYDRIAATDFEEVIASVYKKYENKLLINNSVDFDDLLTLPIILFNNYPDILKKYQEKYKYVLIDEYQDTNQAQYTLTKMISAKYQNICVVGDDSQSIYSWRGANYRNILNFEKDFHKAKTILLEQNYRSTKNILEAANNVIKNNKMKKEKNLWTDNEEGVKIKYHKASNEKEEAEYVTKEIYRLLEEKIPASSIAVLYRTNAQSRNMEEVLLRENIPYKVVGSFYFYNRKEIKDLISYLKLIYNTYDDASLERIINVPKRGIGLKTIENINKKALLEGCALYDAIDSGKELEFKKIIEELRISSESCSLTELVDLVLEKTGMKKELEDEDSMEADIRLENLEEFKTITKNFEEKNGIISLEEFLAEISLVSDIEEHKNNSEVITLMTVHSAKGLEFDYVFIIGLEEGIFPHNNSLFEIDALEEERRLCYVAITRAKKSLYLINARKRTIYGIDSYNAPSRFIEEINEELLDSDVIKEKLNTKLFDKLQINDNIEYITGDKVMHDVFGVGIVVSVDKSILTVAFPHPYGVKKLLKGHKTFRKI